MHPSLSPFLQNHTQSLPEAQWDLFTLACRASAKVLEEASPVHVTFGSHLESHPSQAVKLHLAVSLAIRFEVEYMYGVSTMIETMRTFVYDANY